MLTKDSLSFLKPITYNKNALSDFFIATLLVLLILSKFYAQPSLADIGTSSISGFAVTPSKVAAFVPQGKIAEIPIRVLGFKPQGYKIIWYGGVKEGINITIDVHEEADVVLLLLRVYAYRPGFYQYKLLIELPVAGEEPVKAIPIVSVPITVIVPGVRVTLTHFEVDPITKTVYFCAGFVPYGPGKHSYATRIEIRVDDKIVETLTLNISKGSSLCRRLGPYPPGSIHTLIVTAEALNVSFDGITTEFAIGKLTAALGIDLHVRRLQLLPLGGIVKAAYTVRLTTNASKCTVFVTADLGGYTIRRSYVLTGHLGKLNIFVKNSTIAKYVYPSWFTPFHTIPLSIEARAICLGIAKPAEASISTKIIAFDVTPLVVYSGLAAIAAILTRVYKRRKRSVRFVVQ